MSELELKEYQKESAKWLINTPRAILASEGGTGKTVVTIRAARYVMNANDSKDGLPSRAYIICLSSVLYMWEAHIEEWHGPHLTQVVKSRKTPLDTSKRYYIFSFDIFTGYEHKLPVPLIFIVDEAHNCCVSDPDRIKKKAEATLGKKALSNHAFRSWFLTATPYPKNIANSWSLFNFCSKGAFGSYWEFAEKYSYVKDTLWGKKSWGIRKGALSELVSLTREFVRRDTIDEHLKDLPDEIDITVPFEPTKEVLRIQEPVEDIRDKIARLEKLNINPWSELTRDEIRALGSIRPAIGILKVPLAAEFIKNILDQGKQVVVFAHHNEVISNLKTALGDEAAIIIGATPAKVRQRHVLEFQAGQIPCIILSITAAGSGLTLTASHTAVFVEEYWTPSSLEQAKWRIRRIGQKWPCAYYYLLFKDTVDESVHRCARSRAKDIETFWKAFQGKEIGEEIIWD